MEKIRPISISTNFQLLKFLCQGCVVLRKGERKTSLDVIPLIHHPIFSPTAVQKLPQKLLLPPRSPLSLVPASVTPEDQILLCLIGEGELDTGSSDSLRKAGPCGRKVFSGALSFFFFLPWRNGRVMSRDFGSSPSSTVNQPRSPAKAAQLSPNAAPS